MDPLQMRNVRIEEGPFVGTAAGSDADLSVFEGHELYVVPTAATLTFEHTYTWWGE